MHLELILHVNYATLNSTKINHINYDSLNSFHFKEYCFQSYIVSLTKTQCSRFMECLLKDLGDKNQLDI